MADPRTAVVTGTSSGIGFATSLELARNGHRVFAGMRNPAKAASLKTAAAKESLPVEVLELDVCSDDSVDAAFRHVLAESGGVDVLVNNAGIAGAGPLEETPLDEHRQMFDTNYFGAVRCIQAVLPSMRERKTGCIVNVTSMVGLNAAPNQIAYSASKWALESLGEALAHEVFRFGIRVVNVAPGVIRTPIFENSKEQRRFDPSSPYAPIMRMSGRVFRVGFDRNVQPDAVASVILEAITTDQYKLRWAVGYDGEAWLAARHRIDSDDFVRLGAEMSEREYAEGFEKLFGISLAGPT